MCPGLTSRGATVHDEASTVTFVTLCVCNSLTSCCLSVVQAGQGWGVCGFDNVVWRVRLQGQLQSWLSAACRQLAAHACSCRIVAMRVTPLTTLDGCMRIPHALCCTLPAENFWSQVDAGTPVAIYAEDKEHAMAVDLTTLSTLDACACLTRAALPESSALSFADSFGHRSRQALRWRSMQKARSTQWQWASPHSAVWMHAHSSLSVLHTACLACLSTG
jgi:hypothetical protein